ncbi:AAA family ATPase [Nonomuraea sp. NPDC049637]|uniref:ATP-binding protein n=1 Tax=Nonomuraea sp. NPDC049637 TaxID=3154356 RepID=UPI003448B0EC
MLHGRQAEQARIDQMLDGPGGALVVRGEAGIGKTALLEYAARRTPGRVLRVAGVESEAELPFAALHLLLRPVLDGVGALPTQQAEALLGALGLGEATRGDRFLVGLATLSLLVELSAEGPLVCLVDDAQWLDSESADALVFAARRLHIEPVVVLFSAREDGGTFPGGGLPELRLDKLDADTAGHLLAEQAADLPLAVRDQLVAEAQGNPLALVELPRMLSPEQRAGAFTPLAFSLGPVEPVTDRVLASFRDRIAALPAATRSCLLTAALDDRGELKVLAAALGRLDASLADFAPAERAGLVQVSAAGVVFRHPLVRTAVLLACDIAARMAAHRALADAVDDDRRAWHLAAVTLRPDEDVAGELESLALRARQRGGQATVSAAYARAAELSADPAHAVRRWTTAAGAAAEAGLSRRAAELVAAALRQAGSSTLDRSVLAELARVRAQLAFEADRPLEAVRLLQEGAETADPSTVLSLLGLAGFYAWTSAPHPDQIALARRTEELTPDGGGLAAAVRAISRGFRMILEGDTTPVPAFPDGMGEPAAVPFEVRMVITYHAIVRAEREEMLTGATALVEECRAQGRLGRLPQAITLLTIAQLVDGRHRSARAMVAEGLNLAADVGQPFWRGYLGGVQAWLYGVAGMEEEWAACTAEALRHADDRSWLPAGTWAEYGRVILDLGLGRNQAVLDRLDRVTEGASRHAFIWRYAWPDYVEAAVRAGTPRRAEPVLRRYATWAEGVGQPGPLAVLHRARALLASDEQAAGLYERALVLHGRHEQPFDQARTRLVYGVWLRRQRRRAEARVQLETAMEAFDPLDASPWSARAAGELRATGASPARRVKADDPLATLTPQELQVVRLAVTGASNREIGAQLFLSPRTVAYHLYKAFPKLGVSSRGELAMLGPMT